MKTIRDPFDNLRLDHISELADAMAARCLALRLAANSGDIEAVDVWFDCVRIIGREIHKTRVEIQVTETADGDNRKEAA